MHQEQDKLHQDKIRKRGFPKTESGRWNHSQKLFQIDGEGSKHLHRRHKKLEGKEGEKPSGGKGGERELKNTRKGPGGNFKVKGRNTRGNGGIKGGEKKQEGRKSRGRRQTSAEKGRRLANMTEREELEREFFSKFMS